MFAAIPRHRVLDRPDVLPVGVEDGAISQARDAIDAQLTEKVALRQEGRVPKSCGSNGIDPSGLVLLYPTLNSLTSVFDQILVCLAENTCLVLASASPSPAPDVAAPTLERMPEIQRSAAS